MNEKGKKVLVLLKQNMLFAYFAQGTILVSSILLTLVLPKVLGVEEFGYWQLLIMYVNYLGIAYLGLNDGLY